MRACFFVYCGVDQVRAKTKPASMRMPLEEELEAVVEGAGGEGTEDQQADSASATGFEPVDSQKVEKKKKNWVILVLWDRVCTQPV